MDDEDKADLARHGLEAAELLEPGKIAGKVKGAVKEAASDAVLDGVAAIGRLTGKSRSPARSKAVAAVDLGDALASWDAADEAEFDVQLRSAAARKAQRDAEQGARDEARKMELAELRRSFPEPSRELALLVFNCVDLLEDLSDDAEGEAPPKAELERKERLLTRFAELLAPEAGEALKSFVAHVVEVSRRSRES